MIKIILLLVCLLMCGCENSIITDEAKYKDNAFKDNKEIERVILSKDIKEIDDNVLEAYKYLKKKGYRKYTI